MPGLTGLELAGAIRSVRAGMPIILLSGYSEQIKNGIVNGSDIEAYFKKPIDAPLLLAKVNELLMADKALRAVH